MDRKNLLKRKRILENQIRIFEKKIVDSKSEGTESMLFDKLESIRQSLSKIERRLKE